VLVLDRAAIDSLLAPRDVLDAVERAFRAHATGRAVMPSKVYLSLPEHGGDFRAMPAFCEGAAGLKWVYSYPQNPRRHGLPTVGAVILYSEPATGQTLAVMDGTLITGLRTGAAAALAARCLARPDAASLGLIGCGAQGRASLRMLRELRPFGRILLHDRDPARAEALAGELPHGTAAVADVAAAAGCDVLITCTPGAGPLFDADLVRPGAHVSAIGADAPGKQELDPRLVARSLVVVDDRDQAVHSGEINVPIARGFFRPEGIAATLGEVLVGRHPGRTDADQVTLFDSTGLAIQDVATAQRVYERARERGVGRELALG
jgi:ornithine cyclodeaminase/alanine dehydrogenase